MSLKLLIEDTELRKALKQEAKAALTSLGRSDAQAIHREAIDHALKGAADKVLEQFKAGYNYGPYGQKFQDILRAELREALLPIYRAAVAAQVEKRLEEFGGIEGLVQRIAGDQIRRCVIEEFKKIKEAGEVLAVLKDVTGT